MSELLHRRWLLVLLCVVAPVAAAAAPDPSPSVIVRLYDGTQTDETARAEAIRTAAAILASTGLSVAWHDCTGDAERRHCDHLRRGRGLIIRLAPTFMPGTATSRGSIKTRARDDAAGLILGFAVVEPSTGAGVMATVFMDRVHTVAQRAATSPTTLLGRAIAHEVGHLLLASNEHGTHGLMREVWTDSELALDRTQDWQFTPADQHKLRLNVQPPPAPRTSSR